VSNQADLLLADIRQEVLESAAVNHPYLNAMSSGRFLNLDVALQDFAYQYGLYSARFTDYVTAVVENLTREDHQQTLMANLAEEHGHCVDADLPANVLTSVAGHSHVDLFRRFQSALGVDACYTPSARMPAVGEVWSQQFLALCRLSDHVGIGAIGIGTEMIVSRVYEQILLGIKHHSNLTLHERVFFDLHSQCDEEHAEQLLGIAADLAQDPHGREQIEYGARMAVALRVEFWDSMWERMQVNPASAMNT